METSVTTEEFGIRRRASFSMFKKTPGDRIQETGFNPSSYKKTLKKPSCTISGFPVDAARQQFHSLPRDL